MKLPKFIQKRDGSLVAFDKNLISRAVLKAFSEANEGNKIIAKKITETIVYKIVLKYPETIPSVEEIQDIVEDTLMNHNYIMSAKKYIIYRNERNNQRFLA